MGGQTLNIDEFCIDDVFDLMDKYKKKEVKKRDKGKDKKEKKSSKEKDGLVIDINV